METKVVITIKVDHISKYAVIADILKTLACNNIDYYAKYEPKKRKGLNGEY